MRVLSQSELNRCTKGELQALMCEIVRELPRLPEDSPKLRAAHFNLQNIRRAIARAPLGHRRIGSAVRGAASLRLIGPKCQQQTVGRCCTVADTWVRSSSTSTRHSIRAAATTQ
jgi:hypothetical protein